MKSDNEPTLQFPCDFIIKVFGTASDQFEIAVLTIIRKFSPNLREDAIRSRRSKDGKYLALTITIHANSKEQLDEIYKELTANPYVIMAL